MIVPIVSEAAWLGHLATLAGPAAWTPPSKSTLVVAPHPDDETLGAGGLIASLRTRGIDVTIAAVTDGENAYDDGIDIRETRAAEQYAALARLGVSSANMHRLRLPDSSVTANEEALLERLSPLVTGNTHILAPWPYDFHPDHEACGRAAQALAAMRGAQLTFYFFWTWHRGTIEQLAGLPLVRFPLSAKQARAKQDALLSYRSQLQHPTGAPILPENLLAPAYRSFEVYLPS